MFSRAADAGFRMLRLLIAALLAVMVVLVFGNVLLRYGFNSGITVSEELSRWLFVWTTFLGALVALREHGHLGTDVLISRLGRTGKRVCAVLGLGLMLLATGLLFSGSLKQARINLEVQAPVSGASMAWFYGAGLVFSVAAAGVLLAQLLRVLRPGVSDEDLVNVRESEELASNRALPVDAPVPGAQGCAR